MAFIGWLGNNDRVTLAKDGDKYAPETISFEALPADTYYVMAETGEIYDREREAEEGCYASTGATDDDDVTYDDVFQIDTYTERKVEPFLLTRQRGYYRDYPSINISRDRDSIPPGMLSGGNGFAEVTECATRAEAIATAKALAARWAALIGEPVEVECDSAECGADEADYTALPSGLIFAGDAADVLLDTMPVA